MARETAQQLTASVAASSDKFIELTPAIDNSTAQQLGKALEGMDQTIVIQPAG